MLLGPTHRPLAALLAVLVLLGHFGTVLHFSLVEHAFCALHGVLEEQAAHDHEHDREPAQPAAPRAPGEPADDHHACQHELARPAGATAGFDRPTELLAAAATALLPLPAPATPARAVPLLRLAPKTPPPACA